MIDTGGNYHVKIASKCNATYGTHSTVCSAETWAQAIWMLAALARSEVDDESVGFTLGAV